MSDPTRKLFWLARWMEDLFSVWFGKVGPGRKLTGAWSLAVWGGWKFGEISKSVEATTYLVIMVGLGFVGQAVIQGVQGIVRAKAGIGLDTAHEGSPPPAATVTTKTETTVQP